MTLSPVLVAVEANDAEKRGRDELAHSAWGDRLTPSEFVRREERLRATPYARGAMRTFLLVERGDAARRAYASLETFRVRSRHGMRPGHSFQVASVFTEPSLRGRGHATKLLAAVGARCAEDPRAQAMTLYSDVGAAIYARAGYAARPAHDWVLPAARAATSAVARSDEPAALRGALARHRPRGRFALLPSVAQVGWHRERERIYAEYLGAPTVAHGVLTMGDGHALVAGDLKHGRLVVLSFRAVGPATAAALLAACADEAARAHLREVSLWASPDAADDAALAEVAPWIGAQRIARDGSLPMLRPLLLGLRPDAWRTVERTSWV